jgi:hypothetical protein
VIRQNNVDEFRTSLAQLRGRVTGPPLLQLRGDREAFPGVHALRGVSLEVHAAKSSRCSARTAPASPR